MTASAVFFPRSPIWVAALGARTPLGLDVASTAAAVRAGLASHQDHSFHADRAGEPAKLSYDTFLPVEMPVRVRRRVLLRSAVEDILDSLADNLPGELLFVIALPEEAGPDEARALQAEMKALCEGSRVHVQCVAEGHAAGAVAFGVAARAVEEKHIPAIVAGVDSYCDADTVLTLDDAGLLKSEENRNGFIPGEAAGAVLLCGSDVLQSLERAPSALLRAVSVAHEPAHIESEEVCVGVGLGSALLQTEALIASDRHLISDRYCDLNGVRYRSEELMYTLLRTQHLAEETAEIVHPADCWGDVGAASVPLCTILAAASWEKAYANGPRAAVWGGSHGGRRGVVVLDAAREG